MRGAFSWRDDIELQKVLSLLADVELMVVGEGGRDRRAGSGVQAKPESLVHPGGAKDCV
jgi:hypothetical protein